MYAHLEEEEEEEEGITIVYALYTGSRYRRRRDASGEKKAYLRTKSRNIINKYFLRKLFIEELRHGRISFF